MKVTARLFIGGAVACLLTLLLASPARAQSSAGTLSPPEVRFGPVVVGQTSAVETLTFTPGSTPISVVSINGGPFSSQPSSTCRPGFVPTAETPTCTVAVVFRPTGLGAASGTVTIVSEPILGAVGATSAQSTLSGTGIAAITTTTEPVTTTTTPASTTTSTAPPRTTSSTRPASSTTPTTATTAISGTTTTTSSLSPSTTDPSPTTSTTSAPPPDRRGVTLDATAAGGGRSGPPGIGITVVGSGYPTSGRNALGRLDAAAPPLAQAEPGCAAIYFFLDGRRIGSARPDAAGDVRKEGLSVPGDTAARRQELTSSCQSSGRPVLATAAFDVTDASLHRSALATSLPRADQVDFGAEQLLLSALAVAALLVLIAFPAELFNTTLEEHYDEVRSWVGLKPRPLGGGRHHGILLAVFLLLSGPLWFAMQPSSRFDEATAFGALGLSMATAAVVFAADMPAAVHVRRRYRERARAVALPGAIVIALACVALSRAVNFQPGYFYGLVGGLVLSRSLERDESGRLAARTAVALLVLSIGSWVALLPVSAAAAETGTTLGTILVENLLGGIFWAALDSLVIAMLPLRLLEGSKVIGWSRAAWAALYGVTLLAFVHILLRPSTGYVSNTSVSPPYVVIGLFVAFAIFSFAFWGYFRFRRTETGLSGRTAL